MTTDTDRPIVFLDTETDGLHPDRRPWEIALIRRELDGLETEHLIQIADCDTSNAPDSKGLRIGGYFDRHVTFADPTTRHPNLGVMSEAVAAALVFKVTSGAILVGNNTKFDADTLEAMLRRNRRCPDWHYQLANVIDHARGWLLALDFVEGVTDTAGYQPPPWRSEQLSLQCRVEPPSKAERHTALGDARWVKRLWDRVHGTPA